MYFLYEYILIQFHNTNNYKYIVLREKNVEYVSRQVEMVKKKKKQPSDKGMCTFYLYICLRLQFNNTNENNYIVMKKKEYKQTKCYTRIYNVC